MVTRMDPQLYEELARGDDDGEIDAIIRLRPGLPPSDKVRIVSRFGDIATCRMRRGDIMEVRRHPATRSLKASRRLNNDWNGESCNCENLRETDPVVRRRPRVAETGRGVIVGVVDYGCDFAHHAFRNEDGSTRILKLWDQRPDPGGRRSVQPYRRGRVFDRTDIDSALRASDPYVALDYHPAPGDPDEARGGSHGTHVLDIAAGNGRGEAVSGMAPRADIIFVHVASGDTDGLYNFGDSVGVLEAIDYIVRQAGNRPCAINISMGRHGGPHDGSTLAELAIDNLLETRSGLSIVQSAGNYFGKRIHATGRLRRGEREDLGWQVGNTRNAGAELEIWYSGRDAASVRIDSPDREISTILRPGQRKELRGADGNLAGRAYSRLGDPGNSDNHIDIFLYRRAPTGEWRVSLAGEQVRDGRWHAWIERSSSGSQSRFSRGPVSDAVTCGTIAHGKRAIQVAAHDGRSPPRMTSFSSAGPSRKGRKVPLVAAPGSWITAARSAVPGQRNTHRESTRKRGTSMASPYVTGLVALMLEAAPRANQRVIRGLLRRASRPIDTEGRAGNAAEWGAVDAERAVELARRWQRSHSRRSAPADRVTADSPEPQFETFDPSLDQFTPITPPISQAEWAIIANWIGSGMVPTNGGGAFPPNATPSNAMPLPTAPDAAALAIAQALTANALSRFGAITARTNTPAALQMLSVMILPAVAPSPDEWRSLGEFMERETTLNRTSSRMRPLFGPIDADNRRDMAFFLACARLRRAVAGLTTTNYCSFPLVTPDPAIQILAQSLTVVGPLRDWAQVGLAERQVHVMARLIGTYGYSREAAAGIVGNLTAESGVMTERVEGSRADTPRTAQGFRQSRGRFIVARHSAADIMNRSQRSSVGPRKPGIGLAQWTTAGRRRGLFAASHAGVSPGEFVIYFMDHQIAYLAHELANDYRGLDRRLRRGGVTVDDASDDVVYDFERPGSVLEPDPARPGQQRRRARSDPQVQGVFRERRRLSQGAFDAYERAFPREPAPAARTLVPAS